MLRWRPKSAPSRKRATSRKRVRGARPQPFVNAHAGVDFTHRSECSAGVPKAPLPANGRQVANESGAPAHNHLSIRTRVSVSLIEVKFLVSACFSNPEEYNPRKHLFRIDCIENVV